MQVHETGFVLFAACVDMEVTENFSGRAPQGLATVNTAGAETKSLFHKMQRQESLLRLADW
jgi:hypothetical protein